MNLSIFLPSVKILKFAGHLPNIFRLANNIYIICIMTLPNYQQKYLKYRSLYLETLKNQTGGAAEKKMTSYFFDNDPDNFLDKHLVPNVKPVIIHDTKPIHYDEGEEVYATPHSYLKYCQSLHEGAQQYCMVMNSMDESHGYDPESGITITQIEHFTQLVLSKPERQQEIHSFIFDWDRTLSIFEGLYAVTPTVKDMLDSISHYGHDITISDVACYYFGGLARIEKLQQLWKALTSRGIEIWVLSSNPAVGRFPQFFLDLLESIDLPVPKERMIWRDQLSKYQYIKQFIEKK